MFRDTLVSVGYPFPEGLIYIVSKELLVQDWSLQQVTGIDRATKQIRIYRFTDSMIKASMLKHSGSIDEYDLTRYVVKNLGVSDEKGIVDIHMDQDTLCLLGAYMSAEVRRKDTVIKKEYALCKYYLGQLTGIYPVIDTGFLYADYFNSGLGIITHGHTTHVILSRKNPDNDNRLFATFQQQEGKLIFKRLKEDKLPDEYIAQRIFYMANNAIRHYPYYMLSISNKLTNIETGEEFILKDLFESKLSPGKGYDNIMMRNLYDLKVNEKLICYAMITERDSFNYVVYDAKNDRLISRIPLWPAKPVVPMIDNTDYNCIIYWDGGNIIRQKVR